MVLDLRSKSLIKKDIMIAKYKEYELTKMVYGKYKGYFLKDVPLDYLKWAVMNFTDRGLAEMISVELQRRNPKLR